MGSSRHALRSAHPWIGRIEGGHVHGLDAQRMAAHILKLPVAKPEAAACDVG